MRNLWLLPLLLLAGCYYPYGALRLRTLSVSKLSVRIRALVLCARRTATLLRQPAIAPRRSAALLRECATGLCRPGPERPKQLRHSLRIPTVLRKIALTRIIGR